ncbi:MAG: hypothetical protein HY931_00985 [Candidatus Falkowbacteria bacterium]|nr:MAG: hypothetical protein HY931_00985 [Candidatus Falkowbacteria bacterium]
MTERKNEIVGKIDPKIMGRIEDLKKKLEALLQGPSPVNLAIIRCNGYFREFLREYDRKKFVFAPGDILIDHSDVMFICLGIGKSPDPMEGQVLWFLSERDKEPHYFSEHMPEQMKKNYALVLAA